MNKKQSFSTVYDFFNDNSFIAWRLFKSEELKDHWQDFLIENPELENLLREACRQFDAIRLNDRNLSKESVDHLYEDIKSRIRVRTKNRRFRIHWLAAASCLFLMIVSGTYLLMSDKGKNSVKNEIIGKTMPSRSIQLISGDKIIALQSKSEIKLTKTGEISFDDNQKGAKAIETKRNEINKLIVPFGERSSITFSDGTRVWLNSGSELEFPCRFSGKSREISIKGEIYIEVAKSNSPFLVHTKSSTIRVLGTKFNVAAYPDESEESVVLVEGSVQISAQNEESLILSPNEMALISGGDITRQNVDINEYISWHQGIMTFNKTIMSEVLRKVGRYYNIEFELNNNAPISERRVSGKLYLSSNIDSLMTSLSILSSTDYKRDNDQLHIYKKQ
ncbi:MAG: FecR domain-containing protein [Bacteroidales bacterium]|nr:FecR domain-containing protein [Bacteroidales bacterium]MDD2425558.1 FecR domain-containing protein [Bacteroidales bacterium]MDD3990032.1 FecR domain-containing protein [Bacteroidales bacterium]